jgi:hypothetical protein
MTFEEFLAEVREEWGDELVALVDAGRAEALAKQQAEEAQRQAAETAARAARQSLNKALIEAVIAATPELLKAAFPDLPAAVRAAVERLTDYHAKGNSYLWVELSRSGLARINLQYDRKQGAEGVQVGAYQVKTITTGHDGRPMWGEYMNVAPGVSLPELLYLAARAHQELVTNIRKWQEQLRQRQAELAAQEAQDRAERELAEIRLEQQAMEDAALNCERQAAEVEDEKEIERLLLWARTDPAALNLIRVFLAIEQDRAAMSERIDEAYESAEWAEGRYISRIEELNRRVDDLRRQADTARDDARRYRSEADDLERKLKRNGSGR